MTLVGTEWLLKMTIYAIEKFGLPCQGRYWKASDVAPGTGRLYHHLAILARPNALQQLFYYSKVLSTPDPFFATLESIMTLFDPLLGSNNLRFLPIDSACVKAHGLLFTDKTGSEYHTAVAEFVDNLDNHISRTTRVWMEYGSV